MLCPACDNELTGMEAGEIHVDACSGGCGGVWFDNRELKKVDEPHEDTGALLLDLPRNSAAVIDYDRRRYCPKCDGVVMMRRFASARRRVEVDECPNCGGIWLDLGELSMIRSEFSTEEEKNAATDAILKAQLAEVAVESVAEVSRSRGLAGLFGFLSTRIRRSL